MKIASFLLLLILPFSELIAQDEIRLKLLNPIPEQMFDMNKFFREFSPIKQEIKIEETDHLCAFEMTEFENEIRVSWMDKGPCEQCGNVVEIIYIPGITIEQGFQFFSNFYHIQEDEISSKSQNETEISFIWEYSDVLIYYSERGILIVNNIML